MNCIIKFTFQMGLDWTFLAILPQCVYMVEVHSGSFSHSKSCFPELLVGKHEIGFVCLCQLRWQKLNFKAYKFRPEQNSIRATSARTIFLEASFLYHYYLGTKPTTTISKKKEGSHFWWRCLSISLLSFPLSPSCCHPDMWWTWTISSHMVISSTYHEKGGGGAEDGVYKRCHSLGHAFKILRSKKL